MPRLFARFLLPMLLAGLLAACGGAPAMTVAPAAIDFGAIPADNPVSTTIQVYNQGTAALRIDNVRTSCGCTTATLSSTTVAAGAAVDLQVTFDPQAHPGLYGPLLRIVYLSSNDPTQPELEIPVSVEILAPKEAHS
ncbi:MAG: hypothetical protein DCC57_10915 [Chloroflexi bacterium]|nr:MAG: hypothetical protein DCC57_10915 [Chloroflexota bacterium]